MSKRQTIGDYVDLTADSGEDERKHTSHAASARKLADPRKKGRKGYQQEGKANQLKQESETSVQSVTVQDHFKYFLELAEKSKEENSTTITRDQERKVFDQILHHHRDPDRERFLPLKNRTYQERLSSMQKEMQKEIEMEAKWGISLSSTGLVGGNGGRNGSLPPINDHDPYDLQFKDYLRDFLYYITPASIWTLLNVNRFSIKQVEILGTLLHHLYNDHSVPPETIQFEGSTASVMRKLNATYLRTKAAGIIFKVAHGNTDASPSNDEQGTWSNHNNLSSNHFGYARDTANYIANHHPNWVSPRAFNFSAEGIMQTNLYQELNSYRAKYSNNGVYDPLRTHRGFLTKGAIPVTHWRAIFYLFELDREIQVSIVPKYTNLGDDWKRSLNKGDDRIYTKVQENQRNDIVEHGNSQS